jgi:arsenate reductase
MKKAKVLFLCTHNSARSQMAEAFLRELAGDRFEAFSAGLEPTELNPLARKVMGEIGLDMSEHHAKGVKQFLGKTHFGYLITVCARAEAECPVFPGVSARRPWPGPPRCW